VTKGGTAGDVSRNGWSVDIAKAVLFVANVALFFEDAELGPDSGITGFASDFREDLADGGALEFVEDVHNLSFAPGEGVWLGFSRHMLFFQQLC
jgi:hypothetical protein